MAELTVEQVRSTNGTSPRQRETLRSLKLGRIGKSSTLTDSPQLQGMLRVVGHLVKVSGSTWDKKSSTGDKKSSTGDRLKSVPGG